MDQLFDEVRQTPVPTPEALKALILKAQAGDEAALNDVVKSQARLLRQQISKFSRPGVELDDMLQDAMMMVARAAMLFDTERKTLFMSYYMSFIRTRLRAMAVKSQAVTVPGTLAHLSSAIYVARKRLAKRGIPDPTPAEICAEVKVPTGQIAISAERLAEIEKWGNWNNLSCSLDDPMGENGAPLGAVVQDANAVPGRAMEDAETVAVVERALARINPRDAKVMRYRFGLAGHGEMLLEEIASLLGITRERVRQLEKRAKHQLATGPDKEALREALYDLAARRK
jgi:RNA polymerase primary sigma factor